MGRTISKKIILSHTELDSFEQGEIINVNVDFDFANNVAGPFAIEKGIPFNKRILENQDIYDYLTTEEIQNLLNPESYLGMNDTYIESVIRS